MVEIMKVPGGMKWSNIELKRGVDIDKGLWEWRYQVETGGPDAARTDCTLELCDYDGSPIATYTVLQAWPSKYTGAALNAGANEIAVEAVTLCHEGFKRM
jgi:phage tail-like protein